MAQKVFPDFAVVEVLQRQRKAVLFTESLTMLLRESTLTNQS